MKTNRLCNSCVSHNQVPATHIQERPLDFDELNKIYSNINQHVTRNSIEALRLAFENNILLDVRDSYSGTPHMTACSSGKVQSS
ncbi:ankyrin repeat and EF-hand domain-containing protein 1 isoform X1 [Tachysurus ichikawai]